MRREGGVCWMSSCGEGSEGCWRSSCGEGGEGAGGDHPVCLRGGLPAYFCLLAFALFLPLLPLLPDGLPAPAATACWRCGDMPPGTAATA